MKCFILIGQNASLLERKAVQLFADRSRARSGLEVGVIEEQTEQENFESNVSRIIIGTPDSSALIRRACTDDILRIPADSGSEGFVIRSSADGGITYVAALSEHGVLYGLGKLLRRIEYAAGEMRIPSLDLESRPDKTIRGIYFATHFGNWYCHANLDVVQTYLEDLALWGINELLVWFDTSRIPSLEDGRPLLDRLAKFEAFAGEVGMKVGRIAIANEGFQGQVGSGRPMLGKNCFDETDYHPFRARDRIFGGFDTDICPSQPSGREIILSNKEMMFSNMPKIDSFWLWPYDQGGCNCPQCTPWPKTFMELSREIAATAGRMFPEMTINISAWWFDAFQTGEDDAFFKYLEEENKQDNSWFKSIFAGAVEVKRWKQHGRIVPKRHPIVLFPEISMFDGVPWGSKGSNPAPRKFAAEYAELRDSIEGAFPYSEGIYEDINKFVWAQLLWHSKTEIEEMVREYCRFYFGAGVEQQAEQLILDLENVVTGAEEGLIAGELETRVDVIGIHMEDWAEQGWRWRLLASRCRIQACIDGLKNKGTNDVLIERFRTLYEEIQSELNLHRQGASLEPWIYTPSETALDIILGRADVVNLKLAAPTDDK
ncbi:hypothetical protein [Paenibacillus spongiae]|uniref:Beta-hexosaminidase bacterial type N-terminal domain-containing protein n=1 Tax=Paenibacillus spongiae TaxID=2909671 RepID=A0ABY5SIA6_9BACL|nr:hypothetical protein [Paenibacillus spongiae]UVI33374.1 hypothetical protein L1F29_16700 [Paenibacillus spongiae]